MAADFFLYISYLSRFDGYLFINIFSKNNWEITVRHGAYSCVTPYLYIRVIFVVSSGAYFDTYNHHRLLLIHTFSCLNRPLNGPIFCPVPTDYRSRFSCAVFPDKIPVEKIVHKSCLIWMNLNERTWNSFLKSNTINHTTAAVAYVLEVNLCGPCSLMALDTCSSTIQDHVMSPSSPKMFKDLSLRPVMSRSQLWTRAP